MSPKTLLDTDILSAIMRREPSSLARSRKYLSEHSRLTFSLITRFEVLRGLKAKGAIARAKKFDRFCAGCDILTLTDEIIVRASDIYADLYRRGELISDADILIAANALTDQLVLATNNAAHFARIQGLQIDNWSR